MRRVTSTGILLALVLAACGGGGGGKAGPHWPKSAGAITPDDPAEDGGESLEPRRVSDEAAAVEHGGDDDVTSILDEPTPAANPTTGTGDTPAPSPADVTPEGVPVFEETIIVN